MVIIDYFWLLSLFSTDDKEMVGNDCCCFTRERRVSYIESLKANNYFLKKYVGLELQKKVVSVMRG